MRFSGKVNGLDLTTTHQTELGHLYENSGVSFRQSLAKDTNIGPAVARTIHVEPFRPCSEKEMS
jgi:hypothetical protein